jgi:hypothetical protein
VAVGDQAAKHNCGGALNIIVKATDFVTVAVKQLVGIVLREVFELATKHSASVA